MADNTIPFQAPDPLTDTDNAGPSYVDYRTQDEEETLIDQARQRAQALQASEPAAGDSSAEGDVPQFANKAFAGSSAPMTQAEAMGAGGLQRLGQFGVAAAKDIGNFVTHPTELPRATWYGLQK